MSLTADHLIETPDPRLGNNTYAVDLGDGRALVVDATRDLRHLRQALDHRGLKVAYAADTHLHADFLSGAVQLGHDEGATVVASTTGHRSFEHRGVADEDEIDLGGLILRALATPGHTDEHLSLLLLDGTVPLGAFTGGSLMVDSAARTDLLGDERTSTIGRQRGTNPLLRACDEDSFVHQFLSGLGSYPGYFARLAEQNRAGPPILTGKPALAPLNPIEVTRRAGGGGG